MSEYIVAFGYEPPETRENIIREEIVRCRDCRFYEEEGFCNWFECSYCGESQRVEPDGFCALAERWDA